MQYNTCNYLNDNFGNRTKRHQSHPLFRRYRLSHYILYHAFWIQSAIFVIRKWTFPTLLGLWELAVCWSRFFLRLEKILSAGSSVSIDWPTLHAFGRAGRRPFCRDFFVENGKIFVGKSGQAGKNFRDSKIFDGVNFWWKPKRGLRPEALGRAFLTFVRPEGVSKVLKGKLLQSLPSGAK